MTNKHTPAPWSANALLWLLRYGRKNSGRWDDEVADHEYMPDDDDTKLIAAAPELADALTDMLNGWRYIRAVHGDLPGVGWDRAQQKAETVLAKIQRPDPPKST